MYRIRILIFTALLLPVLVSLGFWQLGRYHQKQALEQQYLERQQTIFSIGDIQEESDLRYYRLVLSGQFINAQSFLLDNKVLNGQAGFHVITPFQADSGEVLLVDRGWIAGTHDRKVLPEVTSVDGEVTVNGLSWLSTGKAFLLAEDLWDDGWPRVIQAVDFERMASVLNRPLQPWLLVLDSNQPGSFLRNFLVVNMPPSRHLGYAVQWFSMALVLVLLGGYAIFRREQP